ncbi:hypothetical protein NIES4101_74310 [Calothrix sp. NIES-4101]|nr:hypothetical protein NIES4101_74310 [Calothrix sp. NIES-4101]
MGVPTSVDINFLLHLNGNHEICTKCECAKYELSYVVLRWWNGNLRRKVQRKVLINFVNREQKKLAAKYIN